MKSNPNKWSKWPRELSWLGGAEAAAIVGVVLAIPFLVKHLKAIAHDDKAFEQTRIADWFRVSLADTASAPIDKTFGVIVPIDVPSISPGYGPLPAVVRVEDQTGAWDAVGQTRTLHLSDKTTAREEITLYDSPNLFHYTMNNWSGITRFLAREAKSQWRFSEISAGQTRIDWNYTFVPRSAWLLLPLLLIVQLPWRGSMKQALRECVRQAEKS